MFENHDYEEKFANRLALLRTKKGVSARDMSLSLGQNPGYINNIETGKALPSMSNFFYICDYLDISPKDFFNYEIDNPNELSGFFTKVQNLSERQLIYLNELISDLSS